ncbi:MAG: bifunctional riboflavin kinase/FAD synthetase [Bacteroidetes bacterium]|nr:bifunctional riboflavin kinase/FAD synthetase [Bacteroidota bacterium]
MFRSIIEYREVNKPVVTIGTFDGVHLGHKQVLNQLKSVARQLKKETLVITFWPHPRQVLSKENDRPRLLNTLDIKIKLFRELGIDNLLIIPFDKEFSSQKPEQFIEQLIVSHIKASAVVIGYDHRFGKNRSGSFLFLKEKAAEFNYQVFEISAFQVGGLSVSSTKIRSALKEGKIQKANEYLGYAYSVEGIVVRGIKLGAKLKFPTANIQLSNEDILLPKDGVYVVEVILKDGRYFGMLNNGINPSIEGKGRSVEVYIFDFEEDIYNQHIQIAFHKRLRDELYFSNLNDLRSQMQQDKKDALKFIGQMMKS